MNYQQIIFTVEKSIARIALNRPEAYNAFSDIMLSELSDVIDYIHKDKKIRVVVITGTGKAFCSGGDVKAMVERCQSGLTFQERRDIIRNNQAVMVQKIKSIHQPVIAAINGVAVGAGCSLALACDLRIASDKAKLGLVFVKRGLIPDWGANYFLPRLIGISNALELVLTGRIIDAQTALRMGLVNKVVTHEELEESVNQICEEIAQNAPLAVTGAKDAVYYGAIHDLASSLEYDAYVQSMCQLTEDHKEGVMSFVEKRPAIFVGK